tara:strand:- start:1252 stop:1428 length:177 start_codon:yes stop_codon:yes gene_type:complete
MKYKVKWIINGEVIENANSKKEVEDLVKEKLESLINNNKITFEKLGASAIQGSAELIN